MSMLLTLALRNARRNVRRTVLTASTVLMGTALVTLGVAWLDGIFGTMINAMAEAYGHIRIVDEDFLAREELAPMYENIVDTAPVVEAARRVPGVVAAYPRIVTGAVMAKGEDLGDEFGIVMGAPEDWYTERLHGPESIISGRWLSGEKDEVVLGRKLAARLGAQVGDEVLLLGQTQYGSMADIAPTVVGIVSSDAMVDNEAFLTLADAQWFVDLPGGALEVLVYTSDHQQNALLPVLAALEASPALAGLTPQAWASREPIPSMMPLVDGMSAFISGLVVFITALAIFNTMTMSVLERTGEIGVMRAMGLSRIGAVLLFVVEAAVIGVVGGIGGALLGGAAGLYLEVVGVTLDEQLLDTVGQMYPMKQTFYADVNAHNIGLAVFLGVCIALLGALFPALRAAGIQPVTAMKARR